MGAPDSPVSVLRRSMDAFLVGDLEASLREMSDDVVWFDQGTNARAGTYRGKNAVRDHAAQIFELTDGTLGTVTTDFMGGDEYAATLERVTGRRHGRELDLAVSSLYRVSDGKIVEFHILPTDQAAWDEFWA